MRNGPALIAVALLLLASGLAWGRAGLPSHNPTLSIPAGAQGIYNNFTPGVCTGANPQHVINVPTGTAASDRIVVVVINVDNAGGLFRTLSAASIGGVGATIDIQSAANPNVVIIHAAVPTGTTATVQFDLAGTAQVCDTWSYSLYGLSSATPDSASNTGGTATSLTTTLNYVYGGVAIGGYAVQGNGGTVTWTGLIVDDARLNSLIKTESAAHRVSLPTQLGASVTGAISGLANASNLSAASWH